MANDTSRPSTIEQVSERVRNHSVSPVELTRKCLARIEQLNPKLNAFITVTAERALAQAKAAEQEIQAGRWRGPLHGIPIGLKDLIDTAGLRTTAGSAVFHERIPEADAEVVKRVLQAGAVILGKQNLHEFAYGGSSLVSHFGAVRNAWNADHIAGGSSGGSATAVAAGMCYAAIGTDTAGSIREPAALCGVVGLKPTYGRVSSGGVIPLSMSLDHVGPIAPSVVDCAILLQAIAGYDPADPASINITVEEYRPSIGRKLERLRIGVPRSFFYEELDPEVGAAVEKALQTLGTLTGDVRELTIDVPTDRSLQSAESYAYHAAGISRHPELYQPETLRRIRSGEAIGPDQFLLLKADLLRIRQEALNVFRDVDVLVTPTTPVPAPLVADLTNTPENLRPAELLLLRNTRPFNIWGFPAISLPCGFTENGLPIGLQISGPPHSEPLILSLAAAFESATPWHLRRAVV